MTQFKSYSQAGQDQFVYDLLGPNGTFLDIGASHPTEMSNTYGLELMGWRGICVEIEHSLCELLRQHRVPITKIEEADATKISYIGLTDMDYLSLDVDERTLEVLRRLPLNSARFKVITIEHDRWRRPQEYKDAIYSILTGHGYVRVKEDAYATKGYPMEDWFVAPELEAKARSLP